MTPFSLRLHLSVSVRTDYHLLVATHFQYTLIYMKRILHQPSFVCNLFMVFPEDALSLKCTNHKPVALVFQMPVSFDDSWLDGRYQTPGSDKASSIQYVWVLFKIFFNVLFSLCRPVDSAFYLICPKHTSLIFAAGCVRGSVSLPLH